MTIHEPVPSGTDTPPPGPLSRLVRDQRVAFLVVGGFNTVLGFALFVLFESLAGEWIGYMGSLACSYAVAIVVAFTLHRRVVFRVRGHVWLDFARFVLVNLGGYLVNSALLPLFHEVLHVPVVRAQLLALVATVVLTYFAHRSFSFHRPS